MNENRVPNGTNPAQVKGDINGGRTGDKRPGFDPAMAPVSTDAEAGGAPMSEAQVREARISELSSEHHDKDISYGDAMRPVEAGSERGQYGFVVLMGIVAVAVMIIAVVALLSM
ncbi:hypothetical protein [Nitratireductor sp. CH_MIT9313-5]|jgi:hypothetical protein|uniref:hypothetical protein n=1 Tax=Nitratireductor sp. CH_MIT9313-5 TaxID=3107764 RepID=UPI00300ABAC4